MKIRVIGLVVLALAAPASAQKPAVLQGPLATAKILTCSFPTYAATRRTGDTVEVINGSQDFSFQIDSFDFRRNRARVVATGTVPVTMIAAPTGLTIIEQTPAGNVNITTVFSGGAAGRVFLAVHSRHLGEIDAPPRPSQAHGKCEVQ
jgi:hypothetical protein